jgi:archaellum component FlaF (FlaF/FlaG flagellin family)
MIVYVSKFNTYLNLNQITIRILGSHYTQVNGQKVITESEFYANRTSDLIAVVSKGEQVSEMHKAYVFFKVKSLNQELELLLFSLNIAKPKEEKEVEQQEEKDEMDEEEKEEE